MQRFHPSTNPFSAAAVSGGRLPYFFSDASGQRDLVDALQRHRWVAQIVGPHGSGKTTLTHHLWRQAASRFPRLVQVTIRGPKQIQRRVIGQGSPCLFVVDGIERLSPLDRWLFLAGFATRDSKESTTRLDAAVGEAFEMLGKAKRLTRYLIHSGGVGPRCDTNAHDYPSFQHGRGAGQGNGLIVTGHRPLPWLPLVFETSVDENLIKRLIDELWPKQIRSGFPGGDGEVFAEQRLAEFSNALLQQHGGNCREILMGLYDFYEANPDENMI